MVNNKIETEQKEELDRLAREWVELVIKQIMEKPNKSDTRCLLVKKH